MRSACRASLFSQEHVCVVACHPCTCVCLCVRVFACVCASTVALNGFLNIASNDFFHRFQSVLTVSCSAFSGLARSSRRAESASPDPHACVCVCICIGGEIAETQTRRLSQSSESCLNKFLMLPTWVSKTHTHKQITCLSSAPPGRLPANDRAPWWVFLNMLLLMVQTMMRQSGFCNVCELPFNISFVMREHGKKKKKSSVAPRCVTLASLFLSGAFAFGKTATDADLTCCAIICLPLRKLHTPAVRSKK